MIDGDRFAFMGKGGVAGDHDEAAHLAGVQQPIRIDAALEGELVGIGALVPRAVLEREDVRVGDHDPPRLVHRDDLVQPLGRRIADQRQPAGRDASTETNEFEMRDEFLGEQRANFRDRRLESVGRVQRLQVGDFERVQRRVVPGAFVERPRSGRFSGRSAIGDVGAFLSDQRLEGGERRPETVVDLITRCCMPPESAESTA